MRRSLLRVSMSHPRRLASPLIPVSETSRKRALWGPFLVVLAATGFSFKAIFIKILYAEFPVDPETLLALRMLF